MVNRFRARATALIDGTAHRGNEDSGGKHGYEKIYLGMIREIARYFEKNTLPADTGKTRLTLSSALWIAMAQKTLFKKHSSTAHALSRKLKEKHIVSASSVLYPKNIKFLSVNPLTNAFMSSDLSRYDTVLDYRDKIVDDMLTMGMKGEEFVTYLCIYLRAFHLEKIPLQYYKYLTKEHYYTLGDRRLFIFLLPGTKGYQPIHIQILDSTISKVFDRLYGEMGSTDVEMQFVQNRNRNEERARRELHRVCEGMTLAGIRKMVQLEYQLHHSPLALTLMLSKKHPKISVLELEKMFPGSIPPELLAMERKNIEIYRASDTLHDEEDEMPLSDLLIQDLEIYDELKRVVSTPLEKKAFVRYLKKWQKFIDKKQTGREDYLAKILVFTKILLDKADPSVSPRPIKPRTLKEYLRISFQYAFKHFVAEGEINERAVRNIEEGILYNDALTIETQRKYKRVINVFLKSMTDFKSLAQIESTINIRRSVVFKDELDRLVDAFIEMDRGSITRLTDSHFLIVYQRAVYVLLAYYCGCRKNELRSRLGQDMMVISDKSFTIDVNNDGIKKIKKAEGDKGQSLKSISAKRRVRFTVSDPDHQKIIRRYLKIVEKNHYQFLFPAHNSQTRKIYKNRVMPAAAVESIGIQLQAITQRYTPLHSLRHSYATNQLMFALKKRGVEVLFEISNKLGHRDPAVTLDAYSHIDLLKIRHLCMWK